MPKTIFEQDVDGLTVAFGCDGDRLCISIGGKGGGTGVFLDAAQSDRLLRNLIQRQIDQRAQITAKLLGLD